MMKAARVLLSSRTVLRSFDMGVMQGIAPVRFFKSYPTFRDPEDIRETFIAGGGPGGQKTNTSNNAVRLVHVPTGKQVKCQHTRSLEQNRRIARQLLHEALDFEQNGGSSKRGKKIERKRKQKARRRARAVLKHQQDSP